MQKNQINNSNVRKIPLRDFFKNPEKTAYTVSPDGRFIAFLAPYSERLNVHVQEIGKMESVRVTNVTDRDISHYFWGNENVILYMKDKNGDENFHLFSVEKDGKNDREITPFENVRCNIVDELYDSKTDILIELNKRIPEVFDVYRLNVVTGEMTMVAENPGNVGGWVNDHNGKIRVAITSDGVNRSILYRDNETEKFRTIITTDFKEQLQPLFFTFDNSHVYALSNLGRDKTAIIRYDIAAGKEIEILYERPDVDLSNLGYSRKRKVLTHISYYTWKLERKFLDDDTKKLYLRLEKELAGYEAAIVSKDDDEKKFVVRTYSDRSLGSYYLYDSIADTFLKLSDVSPWLNENELAETKPVTITTRDGLAMQGYLTLPNGTEAKGLPLVLNPHGGPWVRDVWTYNPEVQFLANRGYAVLQLNYRGSTGFGRKFWELSFKQWGRTMQDDLTDGVNWLVKQGIADAKRVAIYGGSYGGYAVLAGLAFTPDVYAAGVDYVGVSNLFTFLESIPSYWKPYLETMYAMVGHPEKDNELLKETSPVFHADKIKSPLFIAQGRMDPRVNINESDQMVEALKKRNIDVPYMVKDNEGHGFHNEENRFDFYEAMEKFLAKHLKVK
ncbi:MAG: S9 family peptidase [Ignavibacteria bacterium]|nr:S9 family peptidase [Ignavibacteria bacterium]